MFSYPNKIINPAKFYTELNNSAPYCNGAQLRFGAELRKRISSNIIFKKTKTGSLNPVFGKSNFCLLVFIKFLNLKQNIPTDNCANNCTDNSANRKNTTNQTNNASVEK
jgi:hypothetical protein